MNTTTYLFIKTPTLTNAHNLLKQFLIDPEDIREVWLQIHDKSYCIEPKIMTTYPTITYPPYPLIIATQENNLKIKPETLIHIAHFKHKTYVNACYQI